MHSLVRSIRRFLSELRRRNVYQVAVTYIVVGFFVIEGADLTLTRLGLPPWTVTFVIVLVGLGFPIALILAWALEMTPEGVRMEETPAEEAEGSGESPVPTHTTRDLWVGGSVLALVLLGAWWMWSGPGDGTAVDAPQSDRTEVEERSVAVLPFESLNPAQESKTIAQGIHGDLITRLSNVGDLLVKSGESVERYRDTRLSLPIIADSLGARWVVAGEVQQAGGKIQVSAQLIDPQTDANVWAEDYRRTLSTENLFAIQSDITQKITDALKTKLTPGEQRRIGEARTQNLEAYRLYVEGRTHLNGRTEKNMRRAVQLFRQAITQDSTYALAWSGLADAHNLLAFYGHAPPDRHRPPAFDAARRAVELDPDLSEAHASLGLSYEQFRRNGPAAIREYRRAVELKPSYNEAQHWLGWLQLALGQPEKGLAHLRDAVALDPHSPAIRGSVGLSEWLIRGQSEQALDHLRRAIELEAGYATAHTYKGLILSSEDRIKEARKAYQRGLNGAAAGSFVWQLCLGGLGAAHARRGETTRAREMLSRLKDRGQSPLAEALLYQAVGEKTASFEVLERLEPRTVDLIFLRYLPNFASLRTDSRYDEFIRQANRAWGLNPDGSIPERTDTSFDAEADA